MSENIDDKEYLSQMKNVYDYIECANVEIDNKASSMVTVLSAMFALQVTLLFPLTIKNFAESVICLLSLFSYFISLLFFIKHLFLKKYKIYPNVESITDFYESKVDKSEFISKSLALYSDSIKHNNEIIHSKSSYSNKGFYFFIFGLILTIITLISIVVSKYGF